MIAAFTRTAVLSAVLGAAAVLVATTVLELDQTDRQQTREYRAQAVAVGSVLLATSDPDTVRRTIARTAAGEHGRIAVHLPDGTSIGNSVAPTSQVEAARGSRADSVVEHDGEDVHLIPVALDRPGVAVVEVRVPGTVFTSGFAVRLLTLVAAGLAGVATAVVVARMMVMPVVRTTRRLLAAARSLGPGRSRLRVAAGTPVELAALASALNDIGQRWDALRTDERKLVADLTHRLRTPLTALHLDAEGIGSPTHRTRIRQSISSLEAELDAVINGSHEHGSAPRTTCELGAEVSERMRFWCALADERGRPYRKTFTGEPTTVQVPAETVREVIDALMVNVFRHTRPGAPFAVLVVRHADWLTLAVEDGGPGIVDPEAALRRGSSGSGSTGLGLDIVRTCAEGAGGSVHIERSTLGGARVRLRFPVAGNRPAHLPPRAWRLWRGHYDTTQPEEPSPVPRAVAPTPPRRGRHRAAPNPR